MASSTVTRYYNDGTSQTFRRPKQGRKPEGLARQEKIQLFESDDLALKELADVYGSYYWNRTKFIRDAVHSAILRVKNCSIH